MAARIILVEAWPRRIADGVAEPVRLAGGGSAKPYRYNNQRWLAGIAALPTIIAGLSFDGDNLSAGAIPQALEFSWASTKASDLTNLASGYLWPDAVVTIRVGPEVALPPVVLTGKVVDASSADGQLRIILADPAAALRLPVLTDRFAGTANLEGPEEWNGRIKRRAWGRCWNVEGEPINPANNIYCFADPRRPIASIDAVRDSGASAAALDLLAWQGSAEATWSALLSAVAPQGGGVIAPSIACVKWWTEPAGTLTADLRGEIGPGYVETAPEIAARIVAVRNGPPIPAAAIAAAKSLRAAPCGVLVKRDTETVAAVLDSLLGGVSLIWRLDAAGSIDFRAWSWTTPVASARSHQITRRNTFKPVKSRKIGYRTNQTVMARGDIAEIVRTADGRALEEIVERVDGLARITEGGFPIFADSRPGDFHVDPAGLRYVRVADAAAVVTLDGQPVLLNGMPLTNSWRRADPVARLGGVGGLRLENSVGDNLVDPDVLNSFRRRLAAPFIVQINASSTGEIQTEFPLTISVRALEGNTDISAATEFEAVFSPSLTGTINNTPGDPQRGTITLTGFVASGSIKVTGTYPDGVADPIMIEVSRAVAGQVAGGGEGSSSVVDFNWSNVSSASYVQVTDNPLIVNSGATGDLKFEFSSSFSSSSSATHNVQVIARYRTVGASTWFDVAGSEIVGTATADDPEFRLIFPGYVGSGGVLTAATGISSTPHEVALFARRIEGSATITFSSNDSVFSVSQ